MSLPDDRLKLDCLQMSLVGNLADLPLTDIFQIVSLSKRTGVLNIVSGQEKATITFLNGNAIKASSTLNRKNLGGFLKEKGLINDKDEVMTLEEQKKSCEPFGTILVQKNIVSREKMETILRDYIQTIIVDLLSLEEGHFDFKLLSSPQEVLPSNGSKLILEHGIETQHLIIEGLRLLDEKRHRDQGKKEELKDLGFSSLMEENPVSVSEPESEPETELETSPSVMDNTGHPEGLWESIQDEISVEESSTPPDTEKEPKELSFLEQLRSEVGDDFLFEDEEFLPEGEADGEQAEISSLKSMVEELKGPNSLSEVLLLILRYATEFVSRASVFVVREGEIRGFGQFGLPGEDNKANDRIRNTILHEEGDSILSEAVQLKSRVKRPLGDTNSADSYLKEKLGGPSPTEAVVLPVVNNNQTIALLYGDNGSDGETIGDIQALEIFIIQAGFVLDRFLLETKLQDIQER